MSVTIAMEERLAPQNQLLLIIS